MEQVEKSTDSIPRATLDQILQTLGYLASVSGTATYEQVRLFLLKRSNRASPSTATAMWTVARDVLVELQRFQFVEAGALPRSQSLAERHADSPCRITNQGRELTLLFKESQGRAYDRLLLAWVNHHPYFRSLLARLRDGPLYIPDITSAKQIGHDESNSDFASSLVERIASNCLLRLRNTGFPREKADVFRQKLAERVEQVDGTRSIEGLEPKMWVDTIQDKVVIPAFLAAEEMGFDAVTFQRLLKATKDFFAASWTTSHPQHQLRVIYRTCEFSPDLTPDDAQATEVIHHGKSFAQPRFVDALKAAYNQANQQPGAYADAYAVRALVCTELCIQPKVFAACLGDLIKAGPTPELVIYTELPFSPPPAGEEYIEVGRNRIGLLKLTAT